MEWYAIHRHNGVVQYATKYDELYYINGSGFGIKSFDAKKVQRINGYPPQKLEVGTVHLDNLNHYRGIVDVNHKWNGWECPWILAKDIKRFIKEMNLYTDECGIGNHFELDGGVLRITDTEEPSWWEEQPKQIILGHECYYLGNIGWCFEFKTK